MMHPAEHDARPQSTLWMLDLGQPLPVGPVLQVLVAFMRAGLHTAIGILAALTHRNRTSEGQHVEVSLFASALSGMVNQTMAYVAGGVIPTRMGNAHPSLFPYESLPTADVEPLVALSAGAIGLYYQPEPEKVS